MRKMRFNLSENDFSLTEQDYTDYVGFHWWQSISLIKSFSDLPQEALSSRVEKLKKKSFINTHLKWHKNKEKYRLQK